MGLHRGAELPGNDVAAVIVEDDAEIKTAPADDLEIGEFGLLKLVGLSGLVAELGCRLDHYLRRGRDEVLGLENRIGRGLRDKIAFLVGVFDRHFPGREVLVVQRELDESFADVIREAVPHGLWPRYRGSEL